MVVVEVAGSVIYPVRRDAVTNLRARGGSTVLATCRLPVVSLESNLTWKATIRLNSHFFRNNFKDREQIAILNT